MAKGSDRVESDFYPTPEPLALAIAQRMAIELPQPLLIIEPSAGSGPFVRAARAVWPTAAIWAVELRGLEGPNLWESGANAVYIADWINWLSANGSSIPQNTLIIGNPPFNQAHEHIKAALDCIYPGSHLSFLLKLNFLSGKDRAETFWNSNDQLKMVIPIKGRPSFVQTTKATNDSNEYGVFVFEAGYRGPPIVRFPHISWKSPRATKRKG